MATEPIAEIEENIWNRACALIGPKYREMRFRGITLHVRSATRTFAMGGQINTLRVCKRQARDAVFAVIAPSEASQALECIVYRPPAPPQPSTFAAPSKIDIVASSGISLHRLEQLVVRSTPRNVLRVCLDLLTPELVQTLVDDN